MVGAGYLLALYQSGRVCLPGTPAAPSEEALGADVAELDRLARLAHPPGLPPVHVPSAVWGAKLLYAAITCYAFREMDAQQVTQLLAAPRSPAAGVSPAQGAYSVDLALQFLPDLFQLARGLAPGDPLVAGLLKIGREWPLSSVGIAELDADPGLDLAAFIDDEALRTVYLDRIFTRRATARLANPQVARLARTAIGLHDALAPEIASSLRALEVS